MTTPSLSWFAIYREAIQGGNEDVDVLFYRSKENAVTRERIGRQIGVMRGAAAFFASMVAVETRSQRRWTTSIHSQKHRGLIIDLEGGITIVAVSVGPKHTGQRAGLAELWTKDFGSTALAQVFHAESQVAIR